MPPRSTRLSAGVVVVRATEPGWRFLLLRAFNHWDFPKGMVENGEEPRIESAPEPLWHEAAIMPQQCEDASLPAGVLNE